MLQLSPPAYIMFAKVELNVPLQRNKDALLMTRNIFFLKQEWEIICELTTSSNSKQADPPLGADLTHKERTCLTFVCLEKMGE